MLREITIQELLEWRVFAELEPFDEERMDIRIAHVVQTLVNINRDTKKRPQPYELSEFMLPFGDMPPRVKPKQTWQQQKQMAQLIAGALSAAAPAKLKGRFE